MFETIDTEDVSLPVAPVTTDTNAELEEFAPLDLQDWKRLPSIE